MPLIRALCIETHESWLDAHRYLDMDYLRELKTAGVEEGGAPQNGGLKHAWEQRSVGAHKCNHDRSC